VIVVSNASPRISLAKVGCLHLLPDTFGQVNIASEVLEEVVGAGANRPGGTDIRDATWIPVRNVTPGLIAADRRSFRPLIAVGGQAAPALRATHRALT
jgi:predicted nucleic acid-binding protein